MSPEKHKPMEKQNIDFVGFAKRFFFEPMKRATPEPLTPAGTKDLVKLLMLPDPLPAIIAEEMASVREHRIVTAMAQLYNRTLSDTAITWIVSNTESPGDVRMLISYTFYQLNWQFRTGPISLKMLTTVFPEGLPRRAFLNEMWDAQKVDRDGILINALDTGAVVDWLARGGY